jgi:hypothetical protein
MLNSSAIQQRKDNKTFVKNLTNNKLNFAFGGSNKVLTPAEKCTKNELINLSQLIELIKSDAPSNVFKIREIVQNGFNQNIDAQEIKTQIRPLKKSLPFVLFSGFCPAHHNDKSLDYNGCLQVDIDFKFAGGDVKAIELKEVVKVLPYIVLAAISPSGFGLKCLIATDNFDINLHGKVSNAIINDLSKELAIDKIYFDNLGASQPCFVPYDRNVYVNENYSQYNAFKALYKLEQQQRKQVEQLLLIAKQTTTQPIFESDNITTPQIEILKYLTAQLTLSNIDITDGYKDWFKIACCFASGGENGRGLFHSVAALNSEYDFDKNEKKFNEGLKAKFNNIGVLVNVCKGYNIKINDFCKNWIKENAPKTETTKRYLVQSITPQTSILNQLILSDNQYIGSVLKGQKFDIGLYEIKGGTGVGKSWFISKNFDKIIVVSRNNTTLENYSKYGFTKFLQSDSKDQFLELQANGTNKIVVTYKSFKNLRGTANLDGYTIVFDEAHLLSESFKEVRIETEYCYNSINELKQTNTVILMSANDIHTHFSQSDFKAKYTFKKPSVKRSVAVTYNASFEQLKETILKRLSENRKVLLYTNRTEIKYISDEIKTAFTNHSICFFDAKQHGKIDLENLQNDITVCTSALVTGKDVNNKNLAMIFYGIDRRISRSTINQFLGRGRKYKTHSFDVLFEFKNDNENFGNYSNTSLFIGAYGIAKATIEASVNDWAFLRENKERFVTKDDNGKLIVNWFQIINHVQQQISKHTILNTDVLSNFLGSHGYDVTIKILTDTEHEKQEKQTIVTPSELYVLELNELCENKEHETEFLTNVLNRFEALKKVGYDRETALDILNLFRSKMKWIRFVNLIIIERSLTSNDIEFIKLYNEVLAALDSYYNAEQIIEKLQVLTVSKKAKKTDLGRLVESAKRTKTNDLKKVRFLLKNLRFYYDFDTKKIDKKSNFKIVETDYLQGIQPLVSNVKGLFLYSDIL